MNIKKVIGHIVFSPVYLFAIVCFIIFPITLFSPFIIIHSFSRWAFHNEYFWKSIIEDCGEVISL